MADRDNRLDGLHLRVSRVSSWSAVIRLIGCFRTCTSSMYVMTYGQLMEQFHCSREVATLGLTTYIFGLGLGPLVLAPLSEVSTLPLISRTDTDDS
jgi:hypothetical protein